MNIQLIEVHQPNAQQAQHMEQLFQLCKQYDGIANPLMVINDFSQPDDHNCFLLYLDKELVGAAILFSAYEKEGEIAAMINPQYRRQGFFSQILKAIKKEMSKRSIQDLILVCEKESQSGLALIEHWKCPYHHSEYRMKFNLEKMKALDDDLSDFCLKEVTVPPFDDLIAMSAQCFGLDQKEAKDNIEKKVKSKSYQIYRGIYKDQVVGQGGYYLDNQEAWIVGIAVGKNQQKKGLGRKILKSITKLLLENGQTNILLEVYCDNERALQLYLQSGFELVSCDLYYTKV
ncbi:MAG: GNAT family N-acetyltransferase [Spirochaetes bacterium]|nr:GNAT family N-acetyltransferase [Spirochaetota bacterium]